MRSWEEFEASVRELESERAALEAQSPLYVSPLLYRGQASSAWRLDTTLERGLQGVVGPRVSRYYSKLLAVRPQIESVTGHRWTIPSLDEFSQALENRDSLTLPGLPGYEFWAYLRHLGFPSPLLDWSRSPYVAAFFAFNGSPAQHEGEVAVFAYLEYSGAVKRHIEPHIATTGPYVRTHARHISQQSQYSICSVRDNGVWRFASHEDALSQGRENMLKFTIPASERVKVLRLLDRFNLNAFSLFGTDESLAESLANRELVFNGAGLL
jgi:hypothetical protein